MKAILFFLTLVMVALLSGPPGFCGNRKMVEERVQELDRQNKAVVAQMPELPPFGIVKVTADVVPKPEGEKIYIIDKEILTNEKESDANGSKNTED